MAAAAKKRRNRQDLTTRNLAKTRRTEAALEKRVGDLEGAVMQLAEHMLRTTKAIISQGYQIGLLAMRQAAKAPKAPKARKAGRK